MRYLLIVFLLTVLSTAMFAQQVITLRDENGNVIGTMTRVSCTGCAPEPERSQTGFFYPLGVKKYKPSSGGTWLGRDGRHGGHYFKGLYHLGVDMLTPAGSAVYAISDGEVIEVKDDGMGQHNLVAFIKHKLKDNTEFVAIYGHIKPISNTQAGKFVKGGVQIATVGIYYNGKLRADHLHFGIRPGTIEPPTKTLRKGITIGWGRASDYYWNDTNGMVNPVEWIENKLAPTLGPTPKPIEPRGAPKPVEPRGANDDTIIEGTTWVLMYTTGKANSNDYQEYARITFLNGGKAEIKYSNSNEAAKWTLNGNNLVISNTRGDALVHYVEVRIKGTTATGTGELGMTTTVPYWVRLVRRE